MRSLRFVTAALPENFRATAPRAAQEASLLHHAEKKALAALLEAGADEDLLVEINFQMCADCHAFLCHASAFLGREIEVGAESWYGARPFKAPESCGRGCCALGA